MLATIASQRTAGGTGPVALVDGFKVAFLVGGLFALTGALVAGVGSFGPDWNQAKMKQPIETTNAAMPCLTWW